MSKPRYNWWSYAKAMIYAFPTDDTDRERTSVEEALTSLTDFDDANNRRQMVELYFFERKNIDEATEKLELCSKTGKLYLHDFIIDVWEIFFEKLCATAP